RLRSYFFFQAEDGIRDGHVTGVQTCALPILTIIGGNGFNSPAVISGAGGAAEGAIEGTAWFPSSKSMINQTFIKAYKAAYGKARSEERRVGKEWRARWWSES